MRAEDKEALTSREAYAVASQMATTIKEQHELIQRAAELLAGSHPDNSLEWHHDRDRWFKDAGVEK